MLSSCTSKGVPRGCRLAAHGEKGAESQAPDSALIGGSGGQRLIPHLASSIEREIQEGTVPFPRTSRLRPCFAYARGEAKHRMAGDCESSLGETPYPRGLFLLSSLD